MRVSSRADYGVRALFELALRAGQGPIHSRRLPPGRRFLKPISIRCWER